MAKVYGQLLMNYNLKNFTTDTIKLMLVSSAYVFDQDNHVFKSSITGEVAASGDYVAGGVALTGKTMTYNASTNTIVLDAADLTLANTTITARGWVIYQDTGTAATSPILAYEDFGTDKVSSSGNFTIQFDAAGIINAVTA